MLAKIATIWKAVVAALGSLLTVLTLINHIPFLPGTAHVYVGIVIAILTPIVTYLVPNKKVAA